MLAAPASQAAQVSFNLAGGTGTNLSSYSFTSGGVGLTIKTSTPPTTPTSPQSFVSYTAPGVCLFARADTAARCGVGVGGTYNNLSFQFATDVLLSSFAVSQTVPTAVPSPSGGATFALNVLSGGSVIGSSNTISSGNFSTATPSRINFTNPILVKANTPVVFSASSTTTNSSFRISDLVVDTVTPAVDAPGPLSMLGAGAAFRASRRLRRRVAKKPAVAKA